jgi:hypothetical protein
MFFENLKPHPCLPQAGILPQGEEKGDTSWEESFFYWYSPNGAKERRSLFFE